MRRVTTTCAAVIGLVILAGGCAPKDRTVERPTGSGWVTLFNGQDLTGWKPLDAKNNTWQVVSGVKVDPSDNKKFVPVAGTGVLLNNPTGRTSNLLSEAAFGDCELHMEWTVPAGSNSGVYFIGHYEIQILDSFGKEKVDFSDAGGIYAEWINDQNVNGHAPSQNVSKAPGEWQAFDAVFRAPRFDNTGRKVQNARFEMIRHNGTVVHENVELKGITRAGLGTQETPAGPFMLQGDHGPVAFRNIMVKPLK